MRSTTENSKVVITGSTLILLAQVIKLKYVSVYYIFELFQTDIHDICHMWIKFVKVLFLFQFFLVWKLDTYQNSRHEFRKINNFIIRIEPRNLQKKKSGKHRKLPFNEIFALG